MYSRSHLTTFSLLIALCCASLAFAEPVKLSHQGRVLDAVGDPITGPLDITFSIYDVSSGGAPLWTEPQLVTVTDGLFTVNLGTTVPLDFSAIDVRPDSLWLETQIDVDPPLTPRTLLTATPLSALSTGLRGDLLSSPGALTILDPSGDTGIYLDGRIAGATVSAFKVSMGMFVADSANQIRSTYSNPVSGNSVVTALVTGLPGEGANGG